MCDPNNQDGIFCELDIKKIKNYLETLFFDIYMLSQVPDINSNNRDKIKK